MEDHCLLSLLCRLLNVIVMHLLKLTRLISRLKLHSLLRLLTNLLGCFFFSPAQLIIPFRPNSYCTSCSAPNKQKWNQNDENDCYCTHLGICRRCNYSYCICNGLSHKVTTVTNGVYYRAFVEWCRIELSRDRAFLALRLHTETKVIISALLANWNIVYVVVFVWLVPTLTWQVETYCVCVANYYSVAPDDHLGLVIY